MMLCRMLSTFQTRWCSLHYPLLCYHTYFFAKSLGNIQAHFFHMNKRTNLGYSALPVTSSICQSVTPINGAISNKSMKKARRESPEGVLRFKLDMCSKNGDLVEALRLYDEARSNGVQLNQHHYNVLLYLCASAGSSTNNGRDDGKVDSSGVEINRGFEIFQQMVIDKVVPNEATFTSAARLAVSIEDPEMAFDLVKQMKGFDITPKLRSYGPALFGFCKKGLAERAYEVDGHMAESGVMAEEPELSALLKISADQNNANKVYEILHRLRSTVRQVTESTLGTIEDWFNSKDAAKIGAENYDMSKIREGIMRGGGGWHGQGWLGSGPWKVVRTQMDEKGVCNSCSGKLVCIDIDPRETEDFASSLVDLATKRGVKANFLKYKEWLQKHGPFDAVVDGANVSLVKQRAFSFKQLNNVVKQLHQISPSKRLPLIILHRSRVTGGPAEHPINKKILEFWKNSGAIYSTPAGSNDDWYWLYAAVSCNCLLVTNDEMRDHLFQLLGTSFFPRWKEKHQVRMSVTTNGVTLHMPPPYSIVIQESENGSWHVPTNVGDDFEAPRQWLCATRHRQRH